MMSGGVDSAVAAWLLHQQGHQVTGVFMKNWSPLDSQSLADCPWEQDQEDASQSAAAIGIPFRSVNFEAEYRERVVGYLFREYGAGRVPNPDVLCNREIKFGLFKDWAKKEGFAAVASGHYARVVELGGTRLIARGRSAQKDQSYFLWTLGGEALHDVYFPVGNYPKDQVRELARQASLPVAEKKDSQGICFIGQLRLADFLRERLKPQPGEVVTKSGRAVGSHQGAVLYTLGQRHGFQITDMKSVLEEYDLPRGQLPPLFVIDKDVADNRVVVGPAKADLQAKALELREVVWHLAPADLTDALQVQVRYQGQPVSVARLEPQEDGWRVELAEPVSAAAPGQFAVVYLGDKVVGGGVIHHAS